MGGRWEVQCFLNTRGEEEYWKKIINECFREVVRIENLLTDFKPSAFQKINDFAGKSPVVVPREVFQLIEKANAISEMTSGAFDISYATIGHYWRECRRNQKTPDSTIVDERKGLINFKNIELDSRQSTVYLPFGEMRVGLGGIGKGYAVDCLFEKLKSKGLVNFMVNGSGDIRIHSLASAPRMWRVGIRNPFNSDPNINCGLLKVSNGAVATSGGYINKIENHSHHILDPKSGTSKDEIVSATIWTDTSLESDTLATAIMVMGRIEGMKLINQKKHFAILIDNTGKVHLSERAFLKMQKTRLNEEAICEFQQ